MRLLRQVSYYCLIASFCAALNIAILIAADASGLNYVIGTAISFIICGVVGYMLHSRYTFSTSVNWVSFVRYNASMILNVPFSIIALALFRDIVEWPMWIAAPATTVILTLYNIISVRWAIAARRSRVRSRDQVA